MKLDVNVLRYLTKSHFRVLTAIEMGMRNHELVPIELVHSIAKVRSGGVHKLIGDLLRNSLVHRDRSRYEGYRLTYMGYDFLALHTMVARGTITGLGRQIGVGKESDIYLAIDADGRQMALKLHRLGRISFRNVRNKRDYMRNRRSKPGSWLYLSRLAALKEYAFMRALHKHDFPVPTPLDQNRHAILMSLCTGFPMTQIRSLKDPERVYTMLMNLIMRLGRCGLIHGDFNEYNLICSEDEKITLIDFPQMVSTDHPNAQMYFDRDCQGVSDFFSNRLGYYGGEKPSFADVGLRSIDLDREVEASGFTSDKAKSMGELMLEQQVHSAEVTAMGDAGVGEAGAGVQMRKENMQAAGEAGDAGQAPEVGGGESKGQPTQGRSSERDDEARGVDIVYLAGALSLQSGDDDGGHDDGSHDDGGHDGRGAEPVDTDATATATFLLGVTDSNLPEERPADPGATSFMDMAARQGAWDAGTDQPRMPPRKGKPKGGLTEAQLTAKVRRSVQRKKHRGKTIKRKNSNKNREKRKLIAAARER